MTSQIIAGPWKKRGRGCPSCGAGGRRLDLLSVCAAIALCGMAVGVCVAHIGAFWSTTPVVVVLP